MREEFEKILGCEISLEEFIQRELEESTGRLFRDFVNNYFDQEKIGKMATEGATLEEWRDLEEIFILGKTI